MRKVYGVFAEGVFLGVTPSAREMHYRCLWGNMTAEGPPHKRRSSAKHRYLAQLVCDLVFSTHRGVFLKGLVCDSGRFTHRGAQGGRKGATPCALEGV